MKLLLLNVDEIMKLCFEYCWGYVVDDELCYGCWRFHEFIHVWCEVVVVLLSFGENGEISWIVILMIFNELNKLIMKS